MLICAIADLWNVLCCLCYHSSSGICNKLDKWTNQQHQQQSTVLISQPAVSTTLAVMFSSSMTGRSHNIVNSGQLSCSVHSPSSKHCQQQAINGHVHCITKCAMFNGRVQFIVQAANIASAVSGHVYCTTDWSKLPTLSAAVIIVFNSWIIEVLLQENAMHYFYVNFATFCTQLITVMNDLYFTCLRNF